jgi:hypothetical protein
MTEEVRKSIDCIRKGDPIECSAEDYRWKMRAAIILFALDCADGDDEAGMRLALAEVNRLDKMHGCGQSAESRAELT